jgi:hypothetical protein
MRVRNALEEEKLYFASHPVYSSMPQDCLGTAVLTSKLTKILFTHIRHNLPGIMKEIKGKISEVDDRLKDLGPTLPTNEAEKTQLLWGMVTEFISIFKNTLQGKYDTKTGDSKVNQFLLSLLDVQRAHWRSQNQIVVL